MTTALANPILSDSGAGSTASLPATFPAGRFTSNRGDYVLHEKIGAGATGFVWWGTFAPSLVSPPVGEGDPVSDTVGVGGMSSDVVGESVEVAIKVIELDSVDVDLARLSASLRSASIMHHPHLLEQHTSFVSGSELWIVTERASLGSIRDVLTTVSPSGFASETILAAILYQVVDALAYLHASDLIHRDIKSSNLLLHDDGRVLVSDLGAARISWGSYKKSKTLAGSPCFMAPEVLRVVLEASEGYDTKADMWSLGIMAIELATGQPPYYDSSILQIMAEHAKGAPDLKTTLTRRRVRGHSFSRTFRSFVKACLHIDPAERKSAAKLLRHKLFNDVRGPGVAEGIIRQDLNSLLPSESLPARYLRMSRGFTQPGMINIEASSFGNWNLDGFNTPTSSSASPVGDADTSGGGLGLNVDVAGDSLQTVTSQDFHQAFADTPPPTPKGCGRSRSNSGSNSGSGSGSGSGFGSGAGSGANSAASEGGSDQRGGSGSSSDFSAGLSDFSNNDDFFDTSDWSYYSEEEWSTDPDDDGKTNDIVKDDDGDGKVDV